MKFENENKKAKGRPPGAVNKISEQTKNAFNDLISNNLENLQSDLDKLKPIERIRTILEIASFILPKLRSIEVSEIEKESQKFQPITITFTNE